MTNNQILKEEEEEISEFLLQDEHTDNEMLHVLAPLHAHVFLLGVQMCALTANGKCSIQKWPKVTVIPVSLSNDKANRNDIMHMVD